MWPVFSDHLELKDMNKKETFDELVHIWHLVSVMGKVLDQGFKELRFWKFAVPGIYLVYEQRTVCKVNAFCRNFKHIEVFGHKTLYIEYCSRENSTVLVNKFDYFSIFRELYSIIQEIINNTNIFKYNSSRLPDVKIIPKNLISSFTKNHDI